MGIPIKVPEQVYKRAREVQQQYRNRGITRAFWECVVEVQQRQNNKEAWNEVSKGLRSMRL